MKLTADLKRDLIERARRARRRAYAPYSGYPVGAALLASSGRIYTGVNVENAAYPTGICAERSAVFNAVGSGERSFEAVAVVTQNGGSPCGACRQVLSEFGPAMQVLIADDKGKLVRQAKLSQLLPEAFGPGHLQKP
ncbi:MAG: cytidine deaminase [Anaerolineales bacterium]|nr:cytidine deaminase [Anaerolineales bacterium]